MSSTGRSKKDGTKTERRKDDFYATPLEATYSLLDQPEIQELFSNVNVLYEPCAGDLAILDAVRRKHLLPKVLICNDIRPLYYHYKAYSVAWDLTILANEGVDYVSSDWHYAPYRDDVLIITNPPFTLAMPMLKKSLTEAAHVIYLMRLDILGSLGRFEFWQERHPDIYIMSKRHSFTGDGSTDSCYYAWFYFHPKEGGRWKVI